MTSSTTSLAWTYHMGTSLATANGTAGPEPAPGSTRPLDVALPAPVSLDARLSDTLARRASCRRFAQAPLALDDLATILDAAYGSRGTACVTGFEFTIRTVPSAGARHPLGLHVIARAVDSLPPGTYDYVPSRHVLRRTGSASAADVVGIFLGQEYLATAAAVVVLSAELRAPLARYGDRGYRYVLLEAGHVGQNIALACAARALGNLALGGFLDTTLARMLNLVDGVPVYAVAVGRPRTSDQAQAREPDASAAPP